MKKKFFCGGWLRLRLTSSVRAATSSSKAWRISTCCFSALDEVFAVQISGAGINIGQAGQKRRFLLFVIPFRENQIDELVHPRSLGAWSIGLRNNDLRDGSDGEVLVGVERLEHRLLMQLFVHRLK